MKMTSGFHAANCSGDTSLQKPFNEAPTLIAPAMLEHLVLKHFAGCNGIHALGAGESHPQALVRGRFPIRSLYQRQQAPAIGDIFLAVLFAVENLRHQSNRLEALLDRLAFDGDDFDPRVLQLAAFPTG